MRERLFEIESLTASAAAAHEKEETLKLYERLLAQVARMSRVLLSRPGECREPRPGAGVSRQGFELLEYYVLGDKTLVWIIDRDRVSWLALPVSAGDLRTQIDLLRNLVKREGETESVASHLTICSSRPSRRSCAIRI